jgi:hypothetical protein
MKAITIHQPWATLLALGEKIFETRSWSTSHRGETAIHAGKQIDREACEREPIKSVLAKHGFTAENLPTGAVVGIGDLSHCWSIGTDYQSGMPVLFNGIGGDTKRVSLNEEKFGYYENGRFAWEFDEMFKLPAPIPAKGQQRLWNWGRPE